MIKGRVGWGKRQQSLELGRGVTKPRVGPLKGIFGFILFFFFPWKSVSVLVSVPLEAEMTHGLWDTLAVSARSETSWGLSVVLFGIAKTVSLCNHIRWDRDTKEPKSRIPEQRDFQQILHVLFFSFFFSIHTCDHFTSTACVLVGSPCSSLNYNLSVPR